MRAPLIFHFQPIQGLAWLVPPDEIAMVQSKSTGLTPSMSSNVWFSPAMPQMNL